MQCHEVADRLTDLMEGDLSERDEAAALEHLASCANCEQVLAETNAAVDLVASHGRPALSDADRTRMFAALAAQVDISPIDP